jgi:hypothetical protein
MKRIVALGLVGVVLVAAAGCGGRDMLMKEALANIHAYAETIEKKESQERQRAALNRFTTTAEKIDKLPAAEKDELRTQYESQLKQARERLDAALKNQILEGGTPPPNPLDNFLTK